MLRNRFGVNAVVLVALVALFTTASGTALAKGTSHNGKALGPTTVISVTAGKPSELAFKLSKFSKLPAGTFTFKVKNSGLAFHDFKLCTVPVTSAAKNACVGKATAILKPGQTATLTVKLTKNGLYEYLCSVPGHAAAGMKGLLGVGVAVKAATPVATTTTTTTPTTTAPATTTVAATTTTTASSGGSCPNGMTVQQYLQSVGTAGDRDDDDNGGPDDSDGCL